MDLVAFTSTLNPWSQSGETAPHHEQFCTMFTLMDFKIRQVPSLCRRNSDTTPTVLYHVHVMDYKIRPSTELLSPGPVRIIIIMIMFNDNRD